MVRYEGVTVMIFSAEMHRMVRYDRVISINNHHVVKTSHFLCF